MSKNNATEHRLSNYGTLGYGINIINLQPRELIADFTYGKRTFDWRDKRIAIPDQIIAQEISKRREYTANFSSSISTAREFQQNLMVSAGLAATDPETDLRLSGDAEGINDLFLQTNEQQVIEAYEADYDYVVLQLTNVQLQKCVRPDVNLAAASCGHDESKIRAFFDTFGTHVVASGAIGGRLHIRTTMILNAQSAKTISQQKIDIKGQVKSENGDYVHGGLYFNERDKRTSEVYRKSSTKSHEFLGGSAFAKNMDEWVRSLNESDIPTQDVSPLSKRITSLDQVRLIGNRENQYLGLVDCKYTEIFHVLDLGNNEKKRFGAVLGDYLRGRNPFDHEPQRLTPEMAGTSTEDSGISIIKLKKGDPKAVHTMIGWFATYETYAGFEAKPGAHAIVRCRSDAELAADWDEKTVYAGEKIQLRKKTPYLSKYMWVEFVDSFGDQGARLWTENRLVRW